MDSEVGKVNQDEMNRQDTDNLRAHALRVALAYILLIGNVACRQGFRDFFSLNIEWC